MDDEFVLSSYNSIDFFSYCIDEPHQELPLRGGGSHPLVQFCRTVCMGRVGYREAELNIATSCSRSYYLRLSSTTRFTTSGFGIPCLLHQCRDRTHCSFQLYRSESPLYSQAVATQNEQIERSNDRTAEPTRPFGGRGERASTSFTLLFEVGHTYDGPKTPVTS